MLHILVIVFKVDEIYRSHSIIVAINLEALRQNKNVSPSYLSLENIFNTQFMPQEIKSNYVCDKCILRISLEYYNF